MNKARILVVDDELDVLNMFEKYLKLKGFEVFIAINVLEALRIQKRESPDLIVTDYNMPEMNGIDLLREINLIAPGLPVIMISGAADMRTAVDALHEHAFDFLTKPVNNEELVRTIQQALKRKMATESPEHQYEHEYTFKPESESEGKLFGAIYEEPVANFPDITLVAFLRPLDQNAQYGYETAFSRFEIEGPPTKKMIIDLHSVTYINNVGLNFLVDLYKKWQAENKQVVFTDPSPVVSNYMKTLGYLGFFPFRATVAEAIEVLK